MIKNCEKNSMKYGIIWDKIKSLSKREFDEKPLHNNRYISAKIKIYAEFKYKKVKR